MIIVFNIHTYDAYTYGHTYTHTHTQNTKTDLCASKQSQNMFDGEAELL